MRNAKSTTVGLQKLRYGDRDQGRRDAMPADIEHIKGKLLPVKGKDIEDIAAAGLHIDKIDKYRFEKIRVNEFDGVAADAGLRGIQLHKFGRGLIGKQDNPVPVEDQQGIQHMRHNALEEIPYLPLAGRQKNGFLLHPVYYPSYLHP